MGVNNNNMCYINNMGMNINNNNYNRNFSMNITNQNYLSNSGNSPNPKSQSMDAIQFGNNSNSVNNNNEEELPEIIPRPDVFQPAEDNRVFSQDVPIKNITVEASTGLRLVIKAEENTTIKDFLRLYMKKINLDESYIDRDIIFLFNQNKIDSNSMKTIKAFPNFTTITAFDQSNVIGA